MILAIFREMRVIPALISFIFLIIFLAPLSAGIINIGNGFGAFVSAVLTAVFVFNGPVKKTVSGIWEKTGGKIFIVSAAVLAAAAVILAAVISIFMIREMNDRPKNTDTTVVVLGCKVKDGAPSLMLKRRLDAAYDYLSENSSVKVIVSGGQGDDEVISEAQCMKDYLVSRGISGDRIFMEDRSANTDENLKFSAEIIENEGLFKDITIVTDGFHQFRADMLARDNGIKAYNISAKTSLWLLPTYWVREWFGVAYYTVF